MDQPQAVGAAGDAHNPYAMPQAAVASPPAPLAGAYLPASRLARLGARIIDRLLLLVTFAPMVVALVVGQGASGAAFVPLLASTPLLMLALLAAHLVGLHRRGQTVGKRTVGVRILRSDGSHPTLGRSFAARTMLPFTIGFFFGPFALVDALWIFGGEQRCLHDLMADTIVVPAR